MLPVKKDKECTSTLVFNNEHRSRKRELTQKEILQVLRSSSEKLWFWVIDLMYSAKLCDVLSWNLKMKYGGETIYHELKMANGWLSLWNQKSEFHTFHVNVYDYLLTHTYCMKTKHFQRYKKRPSSTHLLKNLFTWILFIYSGGKGSQTGLAVSCWAKITPLSWKQWM